MRRDYQDKFSGMISALILWSQNHGYQVVIGEVQRSKEQAKRNEEKGIGIANSLHTVCMAADLSLFQNGVYLTQTDQYKELGEEWVKMGGQWGGDFGDGGHFSIAYPNEGFKGIK